MRAISLRWPPATIALSTTTVSIKRLRSSMARTQPWVRALFRRTGLLHTIFLEAFNQIPFPQRRFSNGRDPHFDRWDKRIGLAEQTPTLRTLFGGLGFWCEDFALGFRISRDINARSRAILRRIFFNKTKNRLCGHAKTSRSPFMVFGPSCDVLPTN